jgi:hypothetical protein
MSRLFPVALCALTSLASAEIKTDPGLDYAKLAYYKNIHPLPQAVNKSKEGVRAQVPGWYLSASVAAQKDLAPTFVTKWRFPLTSGERKSPSEVNWIKDGLTEGELIKQLAPAPAR